MEQKPQRTDDMAPTNYENVQMFCGLLESSLGQRATLSGKQLEERWGEWSVRMEGEEIQDKKTQAFTPVKSKSITPFWVSMTPHKLPELLFRLLSQVRKKSSTALLVL